MAHRIIPEEVCTEYQAASNAVLINYDAEDVQNMNRAELQRVKELLGHGSEWTVWSTPREWMPGATESLRTIRIDERIKAMTIKTQKIEGCALALQALIDPLVLMFNRYLVLCRIAPIHLRNGRNSLDPSVIATIAFTQLPLISAISIGKVMTDAAASNVHIDQHSHLSSFTARFASVTREDVNSLPRSTQIKLTIHRELKRMYIASARGLWADAPPTEVNLKDATRVSGKFDEFLPEVRRDPHLPLPDDFLCEIGKKSHWIITNLGPSLLDILATFQDLWQEAHDTNAPVTTLSKRCVGVLKQFVWTDADGRPINKLPFRLKLDQSGQHSKTPPKTNLSESGIADTGLEYCEEPVLDEWPPQRAVHVLGLAKILQGAHLFVAGLSTGSRNGEILSLKRNTIRRAANGTVFANGRTFKLVRRHDGKLRDWPLPELAERAIEQQAKLIAIVERLSPLTVTKKIASPRNIPEGINLWFGGRVRGRQATAHSLAGALKKYSESLGLELKPGGQLIRLHRLRKTLARLVALAIVQAPKILQDVFGHKHIEMTVHYILADKALSAEIDEIVRELRIIRCADDLSKFVSSGVTPTFNDGSATSQTMSFSGAQRDGFGGRAAPAIRRAVAEQERVLHRRSEDWGAEDIRDLAEVLTLGGTTWNLVRPGVMCTKSLNQFGPCNKKRGHPDPASCQTSCDHRLEQAWLREDVDGCIAEALVKWELEIASQNDLVAEFWAGQVRMHIGRFADLEKKWKLDLRVQEICGPAMLSEA